MNLKKKILLGVGLLVLVVVIGVPAFLMFRGISQFSSAKDELSMTVNSLRSFYKKNPFPTQVNIEKEEDNLTNMLKWFGKLVDVVTADQVERRDATPTSFITQYNQTRNTIVATAGKKSVGIAETDDAFGFAIYAKGKLPAPEDVPRLMQQMLITERLATILIDANVKKINGIIREQFDSASSTSGAPKRKAKSSSRRSGRRGSSVAQTESKRQIQTIRRTEIYEVQSFTLEFVAKENVILDLLNQLSSSDLFIVVTGVEFVKAGKDLKLPSSEVSKDSSEELADSSDAEKSKQLDSKYPIRQNRRVSGPNVDMPMTVRVDLDVYTFFVHKVKAPKKTLD